MAENSIPCLAKNLIGDPKAPVEITVGDRFLIECEVEKYILNDSKVKLVVGEKDKKSTYTVKLLKSESSDKKIKFEVTSYEVGPHKGQIIEATDGIQSISLGGVQFEVKSVLDPKNPPKGPFGPAGPLSIAFWWGILIILGVLLLFNSSIIGFSLFRSWQRRKLIASLKKHDSSLSPYAQVYSTLRKMQRQYVFFRTDKLQAGEGELILKDLEALLRLYIVRQFQVPALDWNNRLIVSEILNFGSRFKGATEDLTSLLREFQTLKAPTTSDIHQLDRHVRKWVDSTHKELSNTKGGKT